MANNQEVRRFLTGARNRLTPQRAGLPVYGGERRVPGLRREEVAQLAGVSTDYYKELERGNLSGVSESVLLSVARALQLDEAETVHLLDLRQFVTGLAHRSPPNPEARVSPRIAQLIDAMDGIPVVAQNYLTTPVASNALGRALFPDQFHDPSRPLSHALYIFSDSRSKLFYPDWESVARGVVSALHMAAGNNPNDRSLNELIRHLTAHSPHFRTWWAEHAVRLHTSGIKRLNHPLVGPLTVAYEMLQVPSLPGIGIASYLADPGSPTAEALVLLRAWIREPGIEASVPARRSG